MESRRAQGLDVMQQVYGWEVQDGPGDFFGTTVDHLFADIWSRPGLSLRDRRLLLLGALTAQGLDDVADIQVRAALGNAELDADQLREIALGPPFRARGRKIALLSRFLRHLAA